MEDFLKILAKGIMTVLVGYLIYTSIVYRDSKSEDFEKLKTRIPLSHFDQLNETSKSLVSQEDKDVVKRYVDNLKTLTYDGFKMSEDHALAVNMALLNLKQCLKDPKNIPIFEDMVKRSFYDDFHQKLIKKINFDLKVTNLTLFKNDELITFCNWKTFDSDFKEFNDIENSKESDKNKHVIVDDKVPEEEEE